MELAVTILLAANTEHFPHPRKFHSTAQVRSPAPQHCLRQLSLLCSWSVFPYLTPNRSSVPTTHPRPFPGRTTPAPPEGDSPALPPTAGPPRASVPAAPLAPGQVREIRRGHSFGQHTFQTPTRGVSGAEDPGERRTLTLLGHSLPSPAERPGVGTEPTPSRSPRARRAVHVSPKSPLPGPKTRGILQASSSAEPRTTG